MDYPAPHTGHIRILSLRSPKNKNALSRALVGGLCDQIEAIHQEQILQKTSEEGVGGTRILIVASEVDGVFCAGADLKERSKMDQTE